MGSSIINCGGSIISVYFDPTTIRGVLDSAEPCLFLFFPSAILVFLSSGDDDVQDVLDLIIFRQEKVGRTEDLLGSSVCVHHGP